MSRRFFIGVVPEGLDQNDPLKILLGKMKRTLSQREAQARWTPPDLWHVTLLFLGALAERDLARAVSALDSWQPLRTPNLKLELAGVGAFPEPHGARVIWLGVHKSQELLIFRQGLVEHITAAGVVAPEADVRDFVPHLTLARLRNLQSVDDLVRLGGRKEIGSYPLREVVLFESVLQGNIKKYVPISRRVL